MVVVVVVVVVVRVLVIGVFTVMTWMLMLVFGNNNKLEDGWRMDGGDDEDGKGG